MLHIALFLFACSSEPAGQPAPEPAKTLAAEADPHGGIDYADPTACQSCHQAVVDEWKQSMHSRAHRSNDPIFASMRELRMMKQGEQVAEKCVRCHNPMAGEDEDAAAAKAGVSCGACHGPQAVVDEAKLSDGRTVCLHCHGVAKNPQGAATCTTGAENEERGQMACVACHLPPAGDGHKAHTFRGPHRAWYQDDDSLLKEALAVSFERDGRNLKVQLTNTTGHAFPTGFPGRVAQVKLVAEGFEAAPDAFSFKKIYVDADGKPTMPPFAASLKQDDRIPAGGSAEATVELPEGTGPVEAQLVFRLLPPKAAEVLKLADAPEAKPVVVSLGKSE